MGSGRGGGGRKASANPTRKAPAAKPETPSTPLLDRINSIYGNVRMGGTKEQFHERMNAVESANNRLADEMKSMPEADVVKAAQGFGIRFGKGKITKDKAISEIHRKIEEYQQSAVRISAIDYD